MAICVLLGSTLESHHVVKTVGTGGIAGAGLARCIKAIDMKAIKEIVVSWFLTPVIGGIIAYILCYAVSALLGVK